MSRFEELPSLESLTKDRNKIRELSAGQCQALIEQVDQQLVSVLQDIDADFMRCTSTITDNILPEVEKYGEASHKIWQSVKWWKNFYELAAGIKLSNVLPDESLNERDTSVHYVDRSDVTMQANDTTAMSTPQSKPRDKGKQKATFAKDLKTPLDALDRDMQRNFGVDASVMSSANASVPSFLRQDQLPASVTTSLRDLSFDSPDVAKPDLETMSLSDLNEREASPTGGRTLKFAGYSALSQTSKRGPAASTPARPRVSIADADSNQKPRFPSNLPSDWDGLADLSKTPLSAFKSPYAVKVGSLLGVEDSPVIKAPKFRSKSMAGILQADLMGWTPAKESVKKGQSRVHDNKSAQDLLEDDIPDSPELEPPSAMKNWATRSYNVNKIPAPDFSARKSGNTMGQQEEGETSFASDDGDLVDAWGQSYEEEAEGGNSQDDSQSSTHVYGEASFEIEADQPDTLFGGMRKADGMGKLGKFLKGSNAEMNTLHGGKLLESAPFEGSPLAGRDLRSGL